MTVSPHSRTSLWAAPRAVFPAVLLALSLFFAATGASAGMQASAQSGSAQSQDEAPDQSAEQAPAPEKVQAPETVKPPQKREAGLSVVRPYLGRQPAVPRQKGPVVGRAVSILPEPYVAPGSVAVPDIAAPERPVAGDGADVPAVNGETAPEPSLADGSESQADDVQASDLVAGQESSQGDTQALNPSVGQDFDTGFQSATLDDLDPSLEAVQGLDQSAGSEQSLWQGYQHADAAARITAYAALSTRPAVRRLLKDIALGSFDLEPSDTQTGPTALLKARLALLEAIGDRTGYQSLIDGLPADQDWTELEHERARAALYGGDLVSACDLAQQARGRDSDSFWLKIGIICSAARGDRSTVDFQLGILEEAGPVAPGFYELSDLILVEAEQGTAGLAVLSNPLPLDSLSVAMVRLAKAQVTAVDLEGASPLGLDAALTLPGLTEAAFADLVAGSLQSGAVDPASLAGVLRSRTLSEDQTVALFVNAEADPSFTVDLQLLTLLGNESTDPVDRQSAFRFVWLRSAAQGLLPGLAPVMVDLAQDLPPTGDAFDALRLRAALMAGADIDAARYLSGLRATGTEDAPVRAHALVASLPLVVLARLEGAPTFDAGSFELWHENRSASALSALPAVAGQTQLMVALLEGVGQPVDERHWFMVESDLAPAAKAAHPALWRRLLEARRSEDYPKMLEAALGLLAGGSALELSPAMLTSLLFTLSGAGFSDMADQIALALALEAGL